MMRSLYTAATGMEAQQLRMDTISNNLANTNTTGFKRVRAEFEDLLSETLRGAGAPDPRGGTEPTALQVGLGVRTVATTRSMAQGDMLNTGNPMDLAIEGAGYLRVLRPSGEYAYTRAGNVRVDADGRLTTQHGELIDPPINIPTDATELRVQGDGKVFAKISGREDLMELGSLELTLFTNPAGLEAVGNNLFIRSGASGEVTTHRPGEDGAGSLAQGFLEGSNVRAVEEMVDMITTQRAYELNSKVIQTADQMLQKLTTLR